MSAFSIALLAIAIVAIERAARDAQRGPDRSTTLALRPPADLTLPGPPGPTLAATRLAGRAAPTRHLRSDEPDRAAREPEVLVPANGHRAVSRLFDALREGRPEVVSMLMSIDAGESAARPPNGLTVTPLRIDSVVVSSLPPAGSLPNK